MKNLVIVLLSITTLVLLIGLVAINNSDPKIITGDVIKENHSKEIIKLQNELNDIKDKLNNNIPEEIEKIENNKPSGPRAVITHETEESVEDESLSSSQITDPYELEYETFRVIKGNRSSKQATILYDINLEDKDLYEDFFSNNEGYTIIDYNSTSNDYNELDEFLSKTNIEVLVGYFADNINSLTDIRKATGISVIVQLEKVERSGEN